MRHKRRNPLRPTARMDPESAGVMIHQQRGGYVLYSDWQGLRVEIRGLMLKLRRAASYLQPVAFVATYPDGSYLLDPQWSRARATWHKSKGAKITRIRGVMEEW